MSDKNECIKAIWFMEPLREIVDFSVNRSICLQWLQNRNSSIDETAEVDALLKENYSRLRGLFVEAIEDIIQVYHESSWMLSCDTVTTYDGRTTYSMYFIDLFGSENQLSIHCSFHQTNSFQVWMTYETKNPIIPENSFQEHENLEDAIEHINYLMWEFQKFTTETDEQYFSLNDNTIVLTNPYGSYHGICKTFSRKLTV